MTADQIVVTLGGVVLVVGVVWFLCLKKEDGARAAVTSGGYQEATGLVRGGCTPSVIRVHRGQPVWLTFRRVETATCSDQVILDAFGRHARRLGRGSPPSWSW